MSGVWVSLVGPFSAVILRERGLDPFSIGVVSALSALATVLVVPAWGHLADARLGRTRAFRAAVLVAAGAAAALMLPLPIAAVGAVLASFGVLIGVVLSLGDALAMDGLASPERQYGALRALASLAFAVGVIGAGLLYDQAGYAAAPFVALAAAAALWLVLGRVPGSVRSVDRDAPIVRHGVELPADRLGSVSLAFRVQPRLWAVLAALGVSYIGLQGALIFVGIRIVELGGQPSDVALTWGIASFLEIPGLLAAGWLVRRVGLTWTLVIAIVPYAVCIASWGFLPSPLAINATRMVTGLCFGMLTAGRVVMIPRLLPASLQATGQALVVGATAGVGTVVGNLLGGWEYGSLGATVCFVTSGALAIVGAAGLWLVLRGALASTTENLETSRPSVV